MKNIKLYFILWFWEAACFFEKKRQGITNWHCTPAKDVESMTLEEKIDFWKSIYHIFAGDCDCEEVDKDFF